MIIGYARVSSREQGFTSALEQQKDRLSRYGVSSIIADVDSGRNDDRSGFRELCRLIESGSVESVVATRCDRLTRSVITLKKFFQHCSNFGVEVLVLDDAIDTTTAAGKFHLNMLGSLAEMESDRLSERVKFGHDYHRRQGKPYFACFGYVKVGDRLEPDRVSVLCTLADRREWSRFDLARLRVDLVLEKGSLLKALKGYNSLLGVNSCSWGGKGNSKPRGLITIGPSGFGTWLCNPILRGHIAYGRKASGRVTKEDSWELLYSQHEPLIAETEWQTLRELLLGNARKKGGIYSGSSNRPFLGLVRCGQCGYVSTYNCHSLRSDKSVKKYRYICSRRRTMGCDQNCGVREDLVRVAVIDALTARARDILRAESSSLPVHQESEEIRILRGQLRDLSQISPQSPVIHQAIHDIKRQITQLQVRQSIQDNLTLSHLSDIEQVFADPDYWHWLEQRLTPAQVRANYRRWVKSVFVRDAQVVSVELLI